MHRVWQQPLPSVYSQLAPDQLRQRIRAAKANLGSKLLILGHHYQQDAVIEFADFSGDSFELSRRAAAQKGAEFVVFCGVHFMAESADILTGPEVKVILPDLAAGCSMADMANVEQTEECWEQLRQVCPDQTIIPITYVNSSAAIKAFVGQHGGAVCTSSNCRQVLQWALKGGAAVGGFQPLQNGSYPYVLETGKVAPCPSRDAKKIKVLFLPDQHLGRNTAYAMGHSLDQMVLWDPSADMGGNAPQSVAQADFVLWKGHCSVHLMFKPEHVDQVRVKYPGIKVIVHPECDFPVVQKADLSGSTAHIVQQIEKSPAGSQWAVGTEVHLVKRLAKRFPDKRVLVLNDCQCLCSTMFRIDLPHLAWALDNLVEGRVVNQIKVDDTVRQWATVALQRMLEITAK